jgi:hypothetical protein
VDKPTFLRAGGWYLHVLYQLAGLRETPWNLSFSPMLPEGFETVAYDLAVAGRQSRVTWSGAGTTFRRIAVDGVESASAVLTGPASLIELERGAPAAPYLSEASCIVDRVWRERGGRWLAVSVRGVVGQRVVLEVIAPTPLSDVRVNGAAVHADSITAEASNGVAVMRVFWTLETPSAVVTLGP